VSRRGTRLERLETAFPPPGTKARLCQGCGGLQGEEVIRELDHGDEAVDALLVGATDACERCGGQTFYGGIMEILAEDPSA
jgi:hypothetical protein